MGIDALVRSNRSAQPQPGIPEYPGLPVERKFEGVNSGQIAC
jgi:hypothetical protein